MGVMAEIRGALAGGATREQLEAAGYKRSSVYQAQKQLVKPGDGRRRRKVQPADQVPAVRSAVTPALPAPSSELTDMRDQVQLVKLGNELAVAKQQAVRLQPETPEPPSEIGKAKAVVGLLSDIKILFPAPEPSAQMPAAGGSKLSSEQESNLAIARMELEERQLLREEERDKLQVAKKTELIREVGGYISKGLSSFLGVLGEVNAAAPARRQPIELNPAEPESKRLGERPPESIEEDDMRPEEVYGEVNRYRPAEVPVPFPELTYVQKRKFGLLNQGESASRPFTPHLPNPPDIDRTLPLGQKARFFTGRRTYLRES